MEKQWENNGGINVWAEVDSNPNPEKGLCSKDIHFEIAIYRQV